MKDLTKLGDAELEKLRNEAIAKLDAARSDVRALQAETDRRYNERKAQQDVAVMSPARRAAYEKALSQTKEQQ